MKLTKKISAVVLAVLMIVVAVFAGCSSKGSDDKLLTLNFQVRNTLSVLTKSSLNSKKNVTNFLKK